MGKNEENKNERERSDIRLNKTTTRTTKLQSSNGRRVQTVVVVTLASLLLKLHLAVFVCLDFIILMCM